jgi:putative phage-type endonuclease
MKVEYKNRAEWLHNRRELITASDVAAILGWDDRRSPLDVYASKITGSEISDNDAMLLGRCLEGGIATAYAEKTGRQVLATNGFTMWFHDSFPWLAATPDRLIFKENTVDFSRPPETGAPLEIKHAGWMKRRDWEDDAPLFVQIQLQIQMACMGAQWGAFCGVVGGAEIHYGDLDLNQPFIDTTIEKLDEFRWRLKNSRPPEPTMARDLRAVKKLFPLDSGKTVDLSDEYKSLADQWETAKQLSKENDGRAEELESKIRAAIGGATFATLPDGTVLSLKTTARKGYTCEVKPTTYRTLRRK